MKHRVSMLDQHYYRIARVGTEGWSWAKIESWAVDKVGRRPQKKLERDRIGQKCTQSPVINIPNRGLEYFWDVKQIAIKEKKECKWNILN